MCILTVVINHVNIYCYFYCNKNTHAVIGRKLKHRKVTPVGRPPVPTHMKRDKRLVVMLTESETEMLSEAAKLASAPSVSDWVRETLVKEADVLMAKDGGKAQ